MLAPRLPEPSRGTRRLFAENPSRRIQLSALTESRAIHTPALADATAGGSESRADS